jgi:hypothetical protein
MRVTIASMPDLPAAHRELRRKDFIVLWIAAAGPMSLSWLVVAHFAEDPGRWLLVFGFVATIVTLGLWNAREWARLASGLAASVYGLLNVWGAFGSAGRGWILGTLNGLGVAGCMGLFAWYALRPSMRRRFVAARDSIARARAVPR